MNQQEVLAILRESKTSMTMEQIRDRRAADRPRSKYDAPSPTYAALRKLEAYGIVEVDRTSKPYTWAVTE